MRDKKRSDPVLASPWKERARAVFRTFPGPRGASGPLRVALTRTAYADVTAHARESLDHEVCGVLAGSFGEDEEGPFVDVQAAVRGSAAREARGHVTFTQETWNAIHSSLERDHPKLQIVGWYHTHPGFGVEFSEMDVFIQRNFFPLSQQVALVMDPLGSEVGLATSGLAGVRYLDRFWVEGREHRARVASAPGEGAAAGSPSADSVAALETRVSQLVAAVHDLRTTLHRSLLVTGALIGLGVATVVGYAIRRTFVATIKPPETVAFAPVPVTLEGRPALLGVAIVKWDIPEELLALEPGPETPTPPVPAPSPSSTQP